MVRCLPGTVPLFYFFLLFLSSHTVIVGRKSPRQPTPKRVGWGCPLPEGCIHDLELFFTRHPAFSPCTYYASFTSTRKDSCIFHPLGCKPVPLYRLDCSDCARSGHGELAGLRVPLTCPALGCFSAAFLPALQDAPRPPHYVPPPFQKKPFPQGALVSLLNNIGYQDQRAGGPTTVAATPRPPPPPARPQCLVTCRGAPGPKLGAESRQRSAARGARSAAPHVSVSAQQSSRSKIRTIEGTASLCAGAACDTPVTCAHIDVIDTSYRLSNVCERHTRMMRPLL